jgi:hypothetical protein
MCRFPKRTNEVHVKSMISMRIVVIITLFVPSWVMGADIPVREGDIVFQTLRSSLSEAIQIATKSTYTHIGVVLYKGGKPFVFEAVEPVKFTPLQMWIDQGEGGRCVVKRLMEGNSLLTDSTRTALHGLATKFEGLHYDLEFNWDDSRMYCSEIVWKMFKRAVSVEVGRPQKLREFDLSSGVVQKKLADRYGSAIPLEETVISPQAIFESVLLETVAEIK